MRILSTPVVRLLAIAGILLSACANARLLSVHPSSSLDRRSIRKVLIIGLIRTPELRKLFEEELSAQWKARHVNALASVDVVPGGTVLDRRHVLAFARSAGFDTVFVLRLTGEETVESNLEGESLTDVEDTGAPVSTPPVIIASPEYDIDYELTTIRTTVYNVKSAHRIWSATSQILVTGDVRRRVRPLAKLLIRTFYHSK
ncbi:MAG TPA: hypothetical protein VMU17_06405 [Elusimicrobiota bacterium]|nr:hypothetical protein [Elusimicrobiota bacterium]